MLYQLHWQFKDGKTEMRAQREIDCIDDMREFVAETQKAHPLPAGALWMCCDETSEYFVWAKSNQPLETDGQKDGHRSA